MVKRGHLSLSLGSIYIIVAISEVELYEVLNNEALISIMQSII